MADHVGPFRTGAKLSTALDEIVALAAELGEHPSGHAAAFDLQRLEWFDLRNMLTVAHAVTATALARTESRGAHQREDFQTMLPQWQVHQRVQLARRRAENFRCAGRRRGACIMSQETKPMPSRLRR